jgi:hypothetical protein
MPTADGLRPVSAEIERAAEAIDLTVEPATYLAVLDGGADDE